MKNILLFEEYITPIELKQIEKMANNYFHRLGLDIKFTNHFIQRINDKRNGKDITIDELKEIFKEVYNQYGNNLIFKKEDYNAVIKDMSSDINIPFVIKYDFKDGDIDIVLKTIMRKHNFKTSTDIYSIATKN
jgi:hypothetical protein